jgi:hypothetical protein
VIDLSTCLVSHLETALIEVSSLAGPRISLKIVSSIPRPLLDCTSFCKTAKLNQGKLRRRAASLIKVDVISYLITLVIIIEKKRRRKRNNHHRREEHHTASSLRHITHHILVQTTEAMRMSASGLRPSHPIRVHVRTRYVQQSPV